MLNKECRFYPCHKEEELESCEYCFCPKYACYDEKTGGKWYVDKYDGDKVWDCSDCTIPHKKSFKNAIDIKKENIC